MTGKELLEDLYPTLQRIVPNDRTIQIYNEIKHSLSSFQIIDTFSQIKKNERGQGLALEVMLFNKDFIYDIVFASSTVDYISVPSNKVIMTFIESSYGQTTNAQGLTSVTDLLTFTIKYAAGELLVYTTEVKRFSEINRIKTALLNILPK